MSARDDQHIQAAATRAHAGRRSDRRARIQLPSGAYLSVRPDQVRILGTST